MSQFRSSEDLGNGGPGAFLRKLRQGVAETVTKPSIIKKMTETSSSNSKSTSNSSGTSVQPREGSFSGSMPPMSGSNPVPPKGSSGPTKSSGSSTSSYRLTQFEKILDADNVDLAALRKLGWNGIPSEYRTQVWQLLLGHMPTNRSRRDAALMRKRKEYNDSILMYFDMTEADRTTQEGEVLRQILVDLPRTCPDTPFFQQRPIQKMMERILYIWSIRHPASGYVQGMNDLLTPLLYISMQPYVPDVLRCDVEVVDADILSSVEADAYCCLTKLLDNIQDHYTFSQPGLQRMVLRLEDLIHRLDNELHQHLQNEGVQYLQFSFRWMNCLLLRELPLKAILRLWDTYLAEDRGGFENFHVYVCAVLLKQFRDQIMKMHFQDILMFLQDLPTSHWSEEDVEPVLSQAYILSTLFESSPNHLS